MEVVFEVQNSSQKDFIVEFVQPNPKLSGLIVNPLVKDLPAHRSTLFSVKYNSQFRDFCAKAIEDLKKPEEQKSDLPKGTIARNKKITQRLEGKKEETKPADNKKGAPPAKAPAKEDKKAPPPKKGQPPPPDPAEEEERLRKEAEEAERIRVEALEADFDKFSELRKLGGLCYDFDIDDGNISINDTHQIN